MNLFRTGAFALLCVFGEKGSAGTAAKPNILVIHDLNATLMQQLGIEHTRLNFRSQGRDYRLTDVHGSSVKDMLP